jgi:plasmid stability protein
MPVNLSIKNVPEDIHEALKKRAAKNRRSLNNEILRALEESVQERRRVDEQIERLRALRAKQRFKTTTEEIVAMIREDRDSR